MTYTQLEALTDEELLKLDKDLLEAVKAFKNAGLEPTEEMKWLILAVPREMNKRGLYPNEER